MLDKYLIGTLYSNATSIVTSVHYEDDTGESRFYSVLQRRVEKYFRGNEVRGYLYDVADSLCSCQALARFL